MWMKDTLLSLDIIFISKNKVIVDLFKKATPMSEEIYTSKKNTKYILEVNYGIIDNYNITIGDEINIVYK